MVETPCWSKVKGRAAMYISGDINRIAQEALLDAVADPAFFVNSEYRYLAFNEAHRVAVRALYGTEVAVGDSLLDTVMLEEDRRTAQANIDHALAGEVYRDASWYGTDGSRRLYSVTYCPARRDGVIIGVACVSVDATNLLQLNRVEEPGAKTES